MAPYLKKPRGWEIPGREATPESVYLERRRFLKTLGLAGVSLAVGGALAHADRALAKGIVTPGKPTSAPVPSAPAAKSLYPAKRDSRFTLDRPLTEEKVAAAYNNYYEFSEQKDAVIRTVDKFKPRPWTVEIAGLVNGVSNVYNMSDAELEAAKQKLIEQKALNSFYWKLEYDDMQPAFKSGDIWITYAWPNDYNDMLVAGLDAGWMVPSQGELAWYCGFIMGKGTQNYYHCHEYVDSFIGHDACVDLADAFVYASANITVKASDLTVAEISEVRRQAQQRMVDALPGGRVRGPDDWWLQNLDLSKRSRVWSIIDPPDGTKTPSTAE